jgi:TolA-binding protein
MNRRRRLSVIILLGCWLLCGCGGNYAAERMYWKTSHAYADVLKDPRAAAPARFAAAVDALRRITVRHASWQQAAGIRFAVAGMLAERGDPAAAAEYQAVITGFPEQITLCSRAQFALALLYEARGDRPRAREAYDALIEHYPLTDAGLEGLLCRARLIRQTGSSDDAARAYTAAVNAYRNLIDKNPYGTFVPAVMHYVAVACLEQGRPGDGCAVFKDFADRYPGSRGMPLVLLEWAGLSCELPRGKEQAKTLLQTVIAKYPEHDAAHRAHLQLAALYVQEGDYPRALDAFRQARARCASQPELCAQATLSIAAIEEKTGDAAAAQTYREVMERYPRTAGGMQAPLLLAGYYQRAGQAAAAQQSFTDAEGRYRSLIAHPAAGSAGAQAHACLANLYLLQSRFTEAIETLRQLRQAFPSDPRAPFALYSMAHIYQYNLNDMRQAKELYRQLSSEYPSHALAATAREMERN